MKLRNEADGMRMEVMEERRPRERDGRRPDREGLRQGEQGAGDPGCTRDAQDAIEVNVLERSLGEVLTVGGEGRAWVGRFFWGGGG
jgi:hypothetical protein